MKILVVEDQQHILRLVQVHLERAGYEVVTAENANDALIRLTQEPFPLVVLDASLPDRAFSDEEFVRTLRQNYPHLRVILMLQKVSDLALFTKLRRIQEVVDSSVTKPFNPLELIDKVEKLLANMESPSEPAQDAGNRPPIN